MISYHYHLHHHYHRHCHYHRAPYFLKTISLRFLYVCAIIIALRYYRHHCYHFNNLLSCLSSQLKQFSFRIMYLLLMQTLFFFSHENTRLGIRYRELDWLGVAAGVSAAAGPGHRVRWSIRELATPVSSVTGLLTPPILPLPPPPSGPGPALLHRTPFQAAHRKCTFIIPGYIPAARPSHISLTFLKNYCISMSLISFSIFFISFDLSWFAFLNDALIFLENHGFHQKFFVQKNFVISRGT